MKLLELVHTVDRGDNHNMELMKNDENDITIVERLTEVDLVDILRSHLRDHDMLDDSNNLNLENVSDDEFLKMFFMLKVNDKKKKLSKHTQRAYNLDMRTLLDYFYARNIRLKEIGFAEVKAFNQDMRNRFANRTTVRKLDFLRRILEFGYLTLFYKASLSPWITKPSVAKGHYSDRKIAAGEEEQKNREEIRELSEVDAALIVSIFPNIVRSTRYPKQYQARNRLIGLLLLRTGMRSSEIVSLNRGSFRQDRNGNLVADVIGKGSKERTVPIFDDVKAALIAYRIALNEPTSLDLEDTSPIFYRIEDKHLYGIKHRISYDTLYKVVKRAIWYTKKNPNISPHWFRHSFITTFLAKNVPISVVKQVVGHADISTTNLYLERLEDDKIYDAFSKVGF
jgi:integrase/recombinase XerD